MVKKLTTYLPFLVIILFGVIGIKALFHSGYYTSHDGWHQVVRLHYFHKSITEGRFPPDYIRDLYHEYGYPLFIFNYHAPWLIAEPFMLAGSNVFDSIKYTYILGYIASGLTMYFFLKSCFSRSSSLIGSIIYLWTPYRFSNIFVRGSIGEATVFIFLPLYYYGLTSLAKKYSLKSVLIGALGLAGMFLSHAIVAFLVTITSILFILITFLKNSHRNQYLFSLVALFTVGFLLSAYYLVPSVTMKKFTQFDDRIVATNDEGKFARISELLYSRWGFGFATPRLADSMSFQVGIANWLIVSLIILSPLIVKKSFSPHTAAALVLFIGSIYLMTPSSLWFWNILSQYVFNIDFAWRLLTVAVFSSSLLAALLLDNLKGKIRFILCLLIVLTAIYTNRNHLRVNQYTEVPLSLYLDSEKTTNTYDEYLPRKANGHELDKIDKGSQIEVAGEQLENLSTIKSTTSLSINYTSATDKEATVHLFHFPGWKLYLNNLEEKYTVSDFGLIKFTFPQGTNTISLKYQPTPLMLAFRIISLFSFIIVISILKYAH